MSSPFTRPMTDDEAVAYDSGLVDGRLEERDRIIKVMAEQAALSQNLTALDPSGAVLMAFARAIARIKERSANV